MTLLFYDFEVTKYDWLVVIIDASTHEETVIVNDRERFLSFYNEHLNSEWVGYNSSGYDQFIVRAIICDFNPKEVNDWIIKKKLSGWKFSKLFYDIPLITYDTMTSEHGLKQLEAFMGNDIRESSIPFDIDRKLTPEEIEEMVRYCRHDVEQTVEVFMRRLPKHQSHWGLINTFKLPVSFLSRSVPQMVAEILGAVRREYDDEFDIDIPDTLRLTKYKHVEAFFRNAKADTLREMQEKGLNWKDPEKFRKYFYKRKYITKVMGVKHIFAWGGVHGAILKYSGKGYYIMSDVASLYPSLMIRYKYFSRSMRNPKRYINIYNTNLEMKKTKDPKRDSYKLACNMTYGCLKDKHNPLYDPRMANNICVAGQLLLLDLIEKLEPYCTLIQSNTDGILIKIRDTDEDFDRVDDVVAEWEKRTGLVMEFIEFHEVYQKDVNNYIAVDADGKAKAKGAYVKNLDDLDNDLPIINMAIREYLLHGTPPERTVNECNDLVMFQKVVKVSKKYKYALKNATFTKVREYHIDNEGKKKVKYRLVWNGDGDRLNDKTFRVFASTRSRDGGIHKLKAEGKKPEKFANTPEKCFILNKSVVDRKVPSYLDRQYYIDLAKKRIEDFGVSI